MMKIYRKHARMGSSRASLAAGGAALALLFLLLAAGCGRLGLEGEPIGNQRPELIFVNIPAGGTQFGANPTVYWFGSDPDGRVVRYDYAVLPESTVQRYIEENGCPPGRNDAERFIDCADDAAFNWISIFVDSTGDKLPTQERVRLYASFDTLDCDSQVITIATDTAVYIDTVAFNCVSKVIPQFMFIRAIDDLGLSSEIKYRDFMRSNHWPETYISADFRVASADSIRNAWYSLKELTVTYRGVQFSYNGSDRGDYIRDEPPMEFFWRIYGPFPRRTTSLRDTLLADGSLREPVLTSVGPDARSGPWTTDTLGTIYGLWNKYDAEFGPSDTTRSAWFLLVVTGRDDAFVPDPTPAVVGFKAIDPKFERDVLIVADGSWIIGHWATPTCGPTAQFSQNPTCSHEMLKKVGMAAAEVVNFNPSGWDFNKDWMEFNRGGCGHPNYRPRCFTDKFDATRPLIPVMPVEVFARHKLTIWCEDDINESMIGTLIDVTLANYMDVGGKLWMMSRIPLLPSTMIGQATEPVTYDFTRGAAGRILRTYFDLEGLWFTGFQSGQRFPGQPMHSNDEFIGMYKAEGITNPLFPNYVPIDRQHVDNSYLQFLRDYIRPAVVIGAPAVPYGIRGSRSRTVYHFDSWRPALNNAQGKVVLSRFVGPNRNNPIFKSAWFACPPYFMSEEPFLNVVRGMSDWFLNQPIEAL